MLRVGGKTQGEKGRSTRSGEGRDNLSFHIAKRGTLVKKGRKISFPHCRRGEREERPTYLP